MTERNLDALRNDASLARFVMQGRCTGRQLGTGSYGSVEEVEVNGLICAGKKIHEALLDVGNVGVQRITSKYVQECQLMSDLRHPNIVQFLGVCFIPDCQLPLLLMERLEGNLDDLLETVPNIPLLLKQSMLEDVVRGLIYMHQHDPQIVHRDLTAKNILLTSSFVAKITDFGNSRIVNLQPGQLAQTMSRLPGTPLYMPPEALSASSRYGPSLDVFSFGHLALFTLTQVYPDDLLESTYPDPNNPEVVLGRSEVERRREYINLLEKELLGGEQHPLTRMVKQCLQNAPSRRPTTEWLMTSLEEVRAAVEGPYGKFSKLDAVRQVMMTRELVGRDSQMKTMTDELEGKTEEILQLRQQLEDTERTHRLNLQQKDIEHQQRTLLLQEEIHQLRDSLTGLRFEIQGLLAENGKLRDELEHCQAQLQRTLENAESDDIAQKSRDGRANQTPLSELRLPLELEWKRVENMPYSMTYYPEAVVIEGKVYVGGGSISGSSAEIVTVYDVEKDEWSLLPPYQYYWFGMTTINSQLVLVGGVAESGERTNLLGVWNKESQKWMHPFPPMKNARSGPAVVTYNNRWIIVAGGYYGWGALESVEILDAAAGKWFCGSSMPLSHKQYKLSTAVIGNMWYLIDGFGYTERVLCASLDELITTASLSVVAPTQALWRLLPVIFSLEGSTATSLHGALVVLGGSHVRSKCLYAYKPSSKSWVKTGEMPIERHQCACAILSSGDLFIVGGSPRADGTSCCEVYIGKPRRSN